MWGTHNALQDEALPMDLLSHALQGAVRPSADTAAQRRSLLVLGAGGALGSLVLEQALACGRFSPVMAVVQAPLTSTVRGLAPLHWPAPDAPAPASAAHTALIVFERERRSNGRDDAFVLPDPAELRAWAEALAARGTRRLLLVVPHAPSMLPAALKQGFANRDEQALAALGFEHLLILRPAQVAAAVAAAGEGRLQRFAAWWLSQMRWMVPEGERALRAVKLAELVVELAALLDETPGGTRIVPPELLVRAAAPQTEAAQVLRQWLGAAAPRAAAAAATPHP
jgi:hypothetical protein